MAVSVTSVMAMFMVMVSICILYFEKKKTHVYEKKN